MSPKQETNGDDKKRVLPAVKNPLLAQPMTPPHNDLVKMRRLGQTTLAVKPGLVGVNSATKPENLGRFDYAHLRAPLPEDLRGSEIFKPQPHAPSPATYFLMRRSSDGYVSATGMFKAAFPWAKREEEQLEKDYIKSLAGTSQDEVAGNVWISENLAIELADEYGIIAWIHALIDPSPLNSINEDQARTISSPPKYKFTAADKTHLPAPGASPTKVRAATPKSRGRPRGSSPEKKGSPQKSAKKAKAPKALKEPTAATAREASASLQASLNGAVAETKETVGSAETVKIDVETVTEQKGKTETTTTNVTVEMPKGAEGLPLPENPEGMIAKAKEMVEEAKSLEGEGGTSSKRKAGAMESPDEEHGDRHTSKKTKVVQEKLKREKVRNRALIGVAATLVVGAVIPYFT